MRANYDIDVRPVLPVIQAPTLILHRVGDRTVPVEAGRYLAQHIRGARYVELPGEDHLLQAFEPTTLDLLIDEIEEFITGARSGPEPDRVLVTVMFADIVGSTVRAVAVGDRRWREMLDGYVALARLQRPPARATRRGGHQPVPGRTLRRRHISPHVDCVSHTPSEATARPARASGVSDSPSSDQPSSATTPGTR
jgi:hypothetical protein